MASYSEAPTIDVENMIGDSVSATSGMTDNLLFAAADSCGLLGTAQGLVDEAAASVAAAADAAIAKTIETVGGLAKKLKDFTVESASAIGSYLRSTFDSVNTYIRGLFDSAPVDPVTGEKESSFLDDFMAKIGPLVNGIKNVFATATELATKAFNNVNKFLNGDPDAVPPTEGLISDVVGIANDLRVMACNGANQALTALGGGVSSAVDSLAGPLSEGKDPQEIIKEKHSGAVKAKSEVAKADADSVNAESAVVDQALDTGISNQLDQIQGMLA